MDVVNGCLDRKDIERLYAEHATVLTGYACSLTGDRSAAEDVVHQVFARLLRGDIVVRERPLTYLCQAVRNGVMNQRRNQSREVALDENGASWLEAPPSLAETGLAIEAALGRLPEEQREVIVLKVWGRLSFEEIAEAVGAPANTAASRYRYGLSKLRELLKPLGVD
ncbi:MAG TPA: sigma-70 family RNA polymerase sigma factor [Steroidobacteraceae bacterium]